MFSNKYSGQFNYSDNINLGNSCTLYIVCVYVRATIYRKTPPPPPTPTRTLDI